MYLPCKIVVRVSSKKGIKKPRYPLRLLSSRKDERLLRDVTGLNVSEYFLINSSMVLRCPLTTLQKPPNSSSLYP